MIVASLNEKHLRLLFKTGQRGPSLCPLLRPANNQRWKRMCACTCTDCVLVLHCRQLKNPISWTLWRLPSKASRLLRARMARMARMAPMAPMAPVAPIMAPCKEAIYNKSSQAIIGTSKSWLRSKTWLGVYWGHHGEFIDDTMIWLKHATCNMQCGNSHRKHTSS